MTPALLLNSFGARSTSAFWSPYTEVWRVQVYFICGVCLPAHLPSPCFALACLLFQRFVRIHGPAQWLCSPGPSPGPSRGAEQGCCPSNAFPFHVMFYKGGSALQSSVLDQSTVEGAGACGYLKKRRRPLAGQGAVGRHQSGAGEPSTPSGGMHRKAVPRAQKGRQDCAWEREHSISKYRPTAARRCKSESLQMQRQTKKVN